MTTAIFSHSACLGHVTPPGHPERVARLEVILAELGNAEFAALPRPEVLPAARAAILRAHDEALVDSILNAEIPEGRFGRIDADTAMSKGSREAALYAAGAAMAAVDAVVSGDASNAFCAVRPPGHHAERSRAMGFCLFNTVAVAAFHARAMHGLTRIAVVDFDVHHGNGTQDILWNDVALFYASTHQWPLYPGSGSANERGVANNIVNATLPPGAGSREFRAAFDETILPALDGFAPQFVLISAGFDAHAADPLANLCLTEDDFAWATEEICETAAKHCGGRVVSCLEGGYDLAALRHSVAAHVRALMQA